MSGRNFADKLLILIHNLPHFDFRFNRLRHDTPFDIDPNGEYMQVILIEYWDKFWIVLKGET